MKELSEDQHLMNAMQQAKDAFDKYFEDNGLEGGYWDMDLTGYVCDSNFKRWRRLIWEDMTRTNVNGSDEGT